MDGRITVDNQSILSSESLGSYELLASPKTSPQRSTSLESDQIRLAMDDAASSTVTPSMSAVLDWEEEGGMQPTFSDNDSCAEDRVDLSDDNQHIDSSDTHDNHIDSADTAEHAASENSGDEPITSSRGHETPPTLRLSPSANIRTAPLSPQHAEVAYTVFHGVTYLGSAVVNAPRSEVEIKRNMSILNDHNSMAIPVKLLIPNSSDGLVRTIDPSTDTDISTYKLHRILFCARGNPTSAERNCFAFTCSHGEAGETSMFQCHVFRCDLSDAVGKIMYCFSQAFKSLNRKPGDTLPAGSYEDNLYTFDVTLELKEEDGKGGHSSCPQDSGMFKIRRDLNKILTVHINQTSNRELKIERCFGMLVCPGRNMKHSDMHLIEMVNMGYIDVQSRSSTSSNKHQYNNQTYNVTGEWNPRDNKDNNFTVLNEETAKDMRVFMSIAVDLVFTGIREPVRFVIETKVKIYPKSERFWYFSKKQIKEKFNMHLKPHSVHVSGRSVEQVYELENLISETAKERMKALNLSFSSSRSHQIKTPEDEDSDDDTPIVSGTGEVSKDIDKTPVDIITSWADILKKWNGSVRPKQVAELCARGIPEVLRGEIWQRLCNSHQSDELIEAYRILITKESPCEETIVRDLHRTFPAHEYFAEQGGSGQDSLLRLNKAYSVYDEEVGYCQGLSFLGAALLLHMPEEQAFSVLVKIMFDKQLRNFYKDGFHDLHMRFYQLERLLQHHIPDLYSHLLDIQLEAHMYASQWFLTLYTAKFPLYLVYRILDIFLCDGLNTIFKIAIALLKDSRRELLALDFEGVLKFFRVSLPKKYRLESSAQHLLDIALKVKISKAKLEKYEKEFQTIQAAQIHEEDPVDRLERENKGLMSANMRLEQENDSLANEMVMSKVALRTDLDSAEDSVEVLMKKFEASVRQLTESEDMNKRLTDENNYLKEKYRVEVCAVEEENKRNKEIILEYKTICSQLSVRLEKNSTSSREELELYQSIVKKCKSCTSTLTSRGAENPADQKIDPADVNKEKKIRELELELARTKLELVETQCENQEMTHQVSSLTNELQAAKNNWWTKGLSTIKEAVNK